MIISLIAAMGKNRVIGNKGKLPWNMPADLKYFRDNTKGKTVVMGRKTYESIGHPMPNRVNIIITRDKSCKIEGCIVVHSADEAIKEAGKNDPNQELMVIGGSQIYKEFLPIADRIYLTIIESKFEGDAFFPEYDLAQWKEESYEEHERDKDNHYDYTFLVLGRK